LNIDSARRKKPVLGRRAAHEREQIAERRHGLLARREVEVRRPALGVETGRDRDPLDQRRLAAAVLPDDERDPRIERQIVEGADGRQRPGPDLRIGDLVTA
jgi:hypothetical protein